MKGTAQVCHDESAWARNHSLPKNGKLSLLFAPSHRIKGSCPNESICFVFLCGQLLLSTICSEIRNSFYQQFWQREFNLLLRAECHVMRPVILPGASLFESIFQQGDLSP